MTGATPPASTLSDGGLPRPVVQLLTVAALIAAVVYADSFAEYAKAYDGYFLIVVIILFFAACRIGTKIVLRISAEGGELPANDEMFNLPDLSSAAR